MLALYAGQAHATPITGCMCLLIACGWCSTAIRQQHLACPLPIWATRCMSTWRSPRQATLPIVAADPAACANVIASVCAQRLLCSTQLLLLCVVGVALAANTRQEVAMVLTSLVMLKAHIVLHDASNTAWVSVCDGLTSSTVTMLLPRLLGRRMIMCKSSCHINSVFNRPCSGRFLPEVFVGTGRPGTSQTHEAQIATWVQGLKPNQ